MQIIGAREGSAFRVSEDYFFRKPYFEPTHSPTDRSPLKVVVDGTDISPPAREGHYWGIDTRRDSSTYRRVIELPWEVETPSKYYVTHPDSPGAAPSPDAAAIVAAMQTMTWAIVAALKQVPADDAFSEDN